MSNLEPHITRIPNPGYKQVSSLSISLGDHGTLLTLTRQIAKPSLSMPGTSIHKQG